MLNKKDDQETWSLTIDYVQVKQAACKVINVTQNTDNTREGDLYRGMGMILAGLVILYSTGLFRGSVELWLKRYIDDVYGLLH